MKKILILAFVFIIHHSSLIIAQPADYWQQHVAYTIEATLIDATHSLDGKLSVVYTNNSPDTLREVYFHLYNNAFRPGSMMYERAKEQNDRGMVAKFENYTPSDWGGYTIKEISVDGRSVQFEITGTIMKVTLATPLAPKSKIKIAFPFFEQIPRQTRRSGWMNNDSIKYSLAQWYPKVCEYDREGWHHQEYISREFYGVWGEFDVKLTVPARYCVGATGQVQNPEEVGWGYDSIARGVKRGKFYPHSAPGTQNSALTWHFKAENVHDFAWVAHEYIHEWDTWNDTVKLHCLYKPSEEKHWAQAMQHTFFMLVHHSSKIGWYQYRNFYNTHAGDGGMEYPQLIMDGSPNAGLIMHEGGHQWFYGMLGSNETRYAFMDEGFTEFIEMVGMEAYYGRHNERSPYRDTSWLTRMFIPEYDSRRNYYSSYLNLATKGYEEPLMIPHDHAREGVNAGQQYFKTLNGLAQLEYVLGDSVFWAGMKEYFRRWVFKHPTLNDFQRTMEDVSGADLDYYFDQWFFTTRTIDYRGLFASSDERPDGKFDTHVSLLNMDVGVMPIDLTLHYDDGTTGIATIPLGLNQGTSYKKPEAGRIFFPQWDWVKKVYAGTAITPKEVSWYEIDTSYRLMDLDQSMNHSFRWFAFPPIELAFLKQLHTAPPLSGAYGIFRPIVWYEETSKMQFGVGFLHGTGRLWSGDIKLIIKTDPKPILTSPIQYLGTDLYEDSKRADLNRYFDIQYKGNLHFKGGLTTLGYNYRVMNGLTGINLNLDHIIRPKYLYLGPTESVGLAFEYIDRGPIPNPVYPVYHSGWWDGSTSTLGVKYAFASNSGNTRFGLGAEYGFSYLKDNSLFSYFSDYSFFGGWNFHFSQNVNLTSEMSWLVRANTMVQYGIVPAQMFYHIGRANNSSEERNDFWKAVTSIGQHFSNEAHFFYEGGAGVRGYNLAASYGGFGVGTELILPNPLRSWGWLPASIKPLVFADAGWVGHSFDFKKITREIVTDAGIGLKVNILSWLPWQLQGVAEEYTSIPTIGLYFPIYLSHPDDGKGNFAFRYAISLGTTF